MPSLATLAYWESLILLGGFAAIVLWRIATGQISLAYLLDGDVRSAAGDDFSTQSSAGRTQALGVTLFVAGYYLMQVFRHPSELPDIPASFVAMLAGSHAVYLGGKLQDMRSNNQQDQS